MLTIKYTGKIYRYFSWLLKNFNHKYFLCTVKLENKERLNKLWFEMNCTTILGHFFAICLFIFHTTEVQTVILRYLAGINLDWFKSYGLSCSLSASSVNSQKIATDKWPFYVHIWPIFCQLHVYLSQNWDSEVVVKWSFIRNILFESVFKKQLGNSEPFSVNNMQVYTLLNK